MLDGNYFSRQVGVSSVMATDNAAAVGGRAGITFDVELVIPWDTPEAVVDLHSEILLDLEIVPDVIGPTGRWPGGGRVSYSAGKRCAKCACPGPRFSGAGAEFP